MMKREVMAVMGAVTQKLTDILIEVPIAKNKVMTLQLKRVQKSIGRLQSLSEEEHVTDIGQKAMNYLCVLYKLEDEIDKFSFRVARQRKRCGFLRNFTNFNSCSMLIRKTKKILSKIASFHEDEAATSIRSRTSSSAIWPIPTHPSIPIPKRRCLTRSLSTIPHHQKNLVQKKKLTFSYSYNNSYVLPIAREQCSDDVDLAKRYNDLSLDSMICLLYMTLFPKDEIISIRRLLRLWLAEGFVERRSQEIPEDLVQKLFDDLVSRNLIHITKLKSDNSPKQCRLDSDFHDYLLPKAQDIGVFNIHHNLDHFEGAAGPFGVRRLVHQMNTKESLPTTIGIVTTIFKPSLLKSFVSFNRPHKDIAAKEVCPLLSRIINSKFRLLRVLDLEGVNKPTLPNKLGDLHLLKYLGLRRTYLDSLPKSVGDLPYLETLDVKHTNVRSLPDSIWKLKMLRHLNLNDIPLTMPPRSSLTLLTLWGLKLDEKISVKGLSMLLNLRELGIKFRLSTLAQDVLLEWISKLGDLRNLRLTSFDDTGRACASMLVLKPLQKLVKQSHLNLYGILERLPSANEFPPNVKVLTLSISQLNDDPMETLEKLPCLINLRLLGDSFMGKQMVCHRGGFKKLEVLKLWILPGLEEWDVEDEAMENLKQLDIRRCVKLKNVSSRLLLKQRRLEEIKLTGMPADFVARITSRKSTDTSLIITE